MLPCVRRSAMYDWKIGVFDTIIGYESSESPNNPNFTRSYGYTIRANDAHWPVGNLPFLRKVPFRRRGKYIRTSDQRPAFAWQRCTASGAESYKTYMLRSLSRRRKVGLGCWLDLYRRCH